MKYGTDIAWRPNVGYVAHTELDDQALKHEAITELWHYLDRRGLQLDNITARFDVVSWDISVTATGERVGAAAIAPIDNQPTND